MKSAPRVPQAPLEYDAFGGSRTAERLGPHGATASTVLILGGQAMFGLDANRPAARGLLEFGDQLTTAIVDSGRVVVRPDAFEANRDASSCIDAAAALVDLAQREAEGNPLVVIGLSATGPLLGVVGESARCDGFVLVSPPILETYGHRPDRLEDALAEELGIPAEIASDLGAVAPMHLGAGLAPRAVVVHGGADPIAPPADAIGWRASLAAAGVEAARVEIAFAGHDLDPCREAAIGVILRSLDVVGAAS